MREHPSHDVAASTSQGRVGPSWERLSSKYRNATLVLFWKVWLSHHSVLPLLHCCRRVSEDEVYITVFHFLELFLVQIQWVFLG